ncbi:hypothetical protein NDU88_000941 [Pleurodeles waltl]|uniref:Uncharacterized protein n=1 Tax=Pleurodeles waltl TaxID=8319 RepID=A0AAV7RBI5_PLEWA|nr:hypothetical protein NDU88_000941 [Pleurodeles waltl]
MVGKAVRGTVGNRGGERRKAGMQKARCEVDETTNNEVWKGQYEMGKGEIVRGIYKQGFGLTGAVIQSTGSAQAGFQLTSQPGAAVEHLNGLPEDQQALRCTTTGCPAGANGPTVIHFLL